MPTPAPSPERATASHARIRGRGRGTQHAGHPGDRVSHRFRRKTLHRHRHSETGRARIGSTFIRRRRARSIRQLLVERLAIPDTASHELWPFRDRGHRVRWLWQQAPKRGVMPAQFVARAVSMGADASAQSLDLGDQLFARHPFHVVVHFFTISPHPCSLGVDSSPMRYQRPHLRPVPPLRQALVRNAGSVSIMRGVVE